MAVKRVNIETFLQLAQTHAVADVRSPAEFLHAHIPNAFSLPLFSNEERAIVGTNYKQKSRQDAIKIGLDFFGPKMKTIVELVEEKLQTTTSKTILVHCWRGGMRSAAIAWLLDLYGFEVYTLEGGYKAFRNWVLQQFELPYNLQILGGYTGSAKTETLAVLKKMGETVIDLEALANHKGSAFGSLGLGKQPSAEMFENLLALALFSSNVKGEIRDTSCIWLESESQRIGNINLATPFFNQMKTARYVFMDVPFNERLKFILSGYGKFEKGDLINAILRIKKRLGGLDTKNAVNFLLEDNVEACFTILLKYYDKYYEKSKLADGQLIKNITVLDTNFINNATTLLAWKNAQH